MVTVFETTIIFIMAMALAFFAILYNTLISLKNNIGRASADIDVLLQKRYDMIGRLADVVKGYSNYEKSVLLQITGMRTKWMTVQNGDINQKMEQSNQISQTLKTIFADVENYPDLKADNNFLQLQSTIYELETQIADRREFYNDSVNELNTKVEQVPYNLIAKGFGFTRLQFLQIPDEDKNPVKADV